MQTRLKLASLLLLAATFAHAQQPSFQGTWTGQAVSGTGSQVRVVLTIAGNGGKLRLSPSVNYVTTDQCHDRDIPVVVEAQTESELTFAIQGEKVLHGCINESATLKVVDAKTLKGTLKDGRSMTLVRK
ncbi:hypothetical protein [Roseateles sp.]|uniref:hypothetical protein n=1 Tax=Roseateles sp. TaxID=1971397 RepID=UPI0039EC71AD